MPTIQPPNGTRDFYPEDALRRRYITEAWRAASLRHGFDEIDGPTFEHLDLYTVKSGEGIVSELFSFERFGGEKKSALRPEFTPTLARMYAAKAASLPKPTKWFMAGPFFRAERPQRGRLREFLQWNCDILGLDVEWGGKAGGGKAGGGGKESQIAEGAEEPAEIAEAKARADAECIACCVELLRGLGLTSTDLQICISNRRTVLSIVRRYCTSEATDDQLLTLLDRRSKLPAEEIAAQAAAIGLDLAGADVTMNRIEIEGMLASNVATVLSGQPREEDRYTVTFGQCIRAAGLGEWIKFDFSIVRGLAYYTGMVFEVIVDGERAVAGGGRYDNLIELFGGPPTPAVGFGMGDVVLSLVLKDKGLLPEGKELADLLDSPRCRASVRPDVFVISNGQPECDSVVPTLMSQARARGLHARRSYKTTKKIPKLLADAAAQSARHALIIESSETCTLKNLDNQSQESMSIDEAMKRLAPS